MTARDELAQALGGDQVYYEPQRTLHYMKADALIADGWRKTPSRSEVAEWVSGNFVVSNGTQAWVEVQTSIDGFTDAILALMDGNTDE